MLPWINATALDQRRAFIAAYLASDDSIADLARRFRVSRKTAHKFINRYGDLKIGRLDGHAMRIIKTPVRALPMYPG